MQGVRNGGAFRFRQAGPPSNFLCYPCRREDIERCSRDAGFVPFHAVNLLGAGRARPGQRQIKVATAAYRVHGEGPAAVEDSHKSLNVYTVPRELGRAVRAQMRSHGIRLLSDWLQDCGRRSHFWQRQDHWADLYYDARARALIFRERT